jgi:hypothetical protein
MRRLLFFVLSVGLLYGAKRVMEHAAADTTGGNDFIFHFYAVGGLLFLGLFFWVNEVFPGRRRSASRRR